jgi:hypothetical protein
MHAESCASPVGQLAEHAAHDVSPFVPNLKLEESQLVHTAMEMDPGVQALRRNSPGPHSVGQDKQSEPFLYVPAGQPVHVRSALSSPVLMQDVLTVSPSGQSPEQGEQFVAALSPSLKELLSQSSQVAIEVLEPEQTLLKNLPAEHVVGQAAHASNEESSLKVPT